MKRLSVLLASVAALALLSACSHDGSKRTGATFNDTLPLSIGDVPIRAQVAVTGPEQEKGLMYRQTLSDGEGMLFVFKQPQRMAFWMNHVPILLTVGFIGPDGTLQEVRTMLPNDTRSIESPGTKTQFALEMNENWFARHKVKPGAKLDRELLSKALRARGEDPEAYGLK